VSRLRRHVHQRRFTQTARQLKLALYHEPNFLAFDFDGKVVLTVHDLSWIRYESAHPADRVRDMNRWFPKSLSRADAVIVVSEFVKQELQSVFGTPARRVQVVPNGVEPLFAPRESKTLQAGLSRFSLEPQGYWLSVGTIEPRKNLETVLDAFAQLPLALRQRMPLVLVGPRGWGSPALQARIDALSETGQVRWLGFLSRDELATVTAGACGLIYPSFYEGFGLPPLEAMASGVPVVVSNVSSLPEVVGTAGILVEPTDSAHIANIMQQLADDPAYHRDRSTAGLEQSRQFSWSRCVNETVEVYTRTLHR
jgi:O-antigen biosynthesis alpha-1,3-rhamnosyltransferase